MLNNLRMLLESDTGDVDPGMDEIDISGVTTSDHIKSIFLDDPKSAVIGAENDPEIQKFIESIPVDDDKPLSATEIDKLAEGFAYGSESEASITDRLATNYYSEFDDTIETETEFDDTKGISLENNDDDNYDDESDDNIIDRITSENYDYLSL